MRKVKVETAAQERNGIIFQAAWALTGNQKREEFGGGVRSIRRATVGSLSIMITDMFDGSQMLDLWCPPHGKVAAFVMASVAAEPKVVTLKAATVAAWLPALISAAADASGITIPGVGGGNA